MTTTVFEDILVRAALLTSASDGDIADVEIETIIDVFTESIADASHVIDRLQEHASQFLDYGSFHDESFVLIRHYEFSHGERKRLFVVVLKVLMADSETDKGEIQLVGELCEAMDITVEDLRKIMPSQIPLINHIIERMHD